MFISARALGLIALSLISLTNVAQAGNAGNSVKQGFASTNSGSYGMAGCGLGSIVFGQQKGFIQVIAATLNGTAGSQTFGISSGTSNCVDGGGGVSQNLSLFIEVNRIALNNDVSRGEGETIRHLSNVLQCRDSQALGTAMKQNLGDSILSPSVESEQISNQILNMMKNDGNLAKACGFIG